MMDCDHDWELRAIKDGKEWNRCKKCNVLKTGYPNPKPATTEPPVWKGGEPVPVLNPGESIVLDGKPWIIVQTVTPSPCTAEEAIERVDRALEAFIARRVKKREVNAAPTSAEVIAEKRARWAAEDQARDFARAMSTPLTFTARLGMKHP